MRLSLSFKLLIGLSLLIFTLTGSISYFSSAYLKESILERERDFNLTLTESKTKEVEAYLDRQLLQINFLTELLLESARQPAHANRVKIQYGPPTLEVDVQTESARREVTEKNNKFLHAFQQNKNLLALQLISLSGQTAAADFKKTDWSQLKNLGSEQRQNEHLTAQIELLQAHPSEYLLLNTTGVYSSNHQSADHKPYSIISFYIPYSRLNKKLDQIVIAHFKSDDLQKIFSHHPVGHLKLVNRRGDVLASTGQAAEPVTVAGSDVFSFSQQHPLPSYSGLFTDQEQENILSFVKSAHGVTVFGEVSSQVVLAPAELVILTTLRVAGLFLAASLFLLFLFSQNITRPLEKITHIAFEIAKGRFEHNPGADLKQYFKDEVHTLTIAMEKMLKGLKERERFRTLFNKFHGSAVTEDLLQNEIALRGEKKNLFVFFSDLRGFTQMSESQDPSQVVCMLNEYFSYMVPVINRHGGVVDKFIGDAIMAVWGVPHSQADNGQQALRACLEMRLALNSLNEKRLERGEPALMVGMALHYGEAISGTIGSDERMEYTVIGNTVNTASRIEASTKAFGTDLLVSEEVVQQLSKEFKYEDAGQVEVKGRSQALKLFKVSGYFSADGTLTEVKTPYSVYGAEGADKVKVVA